MPFQNKLNKELEKYFAEIMSHCNNDLTESHEWYISSCTTVPFGWLNINWRAIHRKCLRKNHKTNQCYVKIHMKVYFNYGYLTYKVNKISGKICFLKYKFWSAHTQIGRFLMHLKLAYAYQTHGWSFSAWEVGTHFH